MIPRPLLYFMLVVAPATTAFLVYLAINYHGTIPGLIINIPFSYRLFRLSLNGLRKPRK